MLGGGVVPGSLTLVGGEPGVGKSTLLLQMADLLTRAATSDAADGSSGGGSSGGGGGKESMCGRRAQDVQQPAAAAAQQHDGSDAGGSSGGEEGLGGSGGVVLYVSGEESVEQIGSRAERMGLAGNQSVYVYSATRLDTILDEIIWLQVGGRFHVGLVSGCRVLDRRQVPSVVGLVSSGCSTVLHEVNCNGSCEQPGFVALVGLLARQQLATSLQKTRPLVPHLGGLLLICPLLQPAAVIVDSIQTVYLDEVSSSAGSVVQVGGCACGCALQYYSMARCAMWVHCAMWLHCALLCTRSSLFRVPVAQVRAAPRSCCKSPIRNELLPSFWLPMSSPCAMQVRECATALLQVAKRERIPVFLVGHVTKSGDLAGKFGCLACSWLGRNGYYARRCTFGDANASHVSWLNHFDRPAPNQCRPPCAGTHCGHRGVQGVKSKP